jgi:hypothetical protein
MVIMVDVSHTKKMQIYNIRDVKWKQREPRHHTDTIQTLLHNVQQCTNFAAYKTNWSHHMRDDTMLWGSVITVLRGEIVIQDL